MLKKLKLFLMLIGISAIFCTNTFAVSKDDIIGYVNSQTVCGDTSLFNTYKSTFTRLLRQKKLTESELNIIYSYLQSAVGTLNSKGVCKLSDVTKLTKSERDSVYGNLTAGAGIITKAPLLTFGEEDTTNNGKNESIKDNEKLNSNIEQNKTNEGTKVTINTKDNTMDIYENGVLIDKVSMDSQKMTYTGSNISQILIIVVSLLCFVIALIPFIVLSKEHTAKRRFIKNMLVSIMICSLTIGSTVIVFGSKIDELVAMVDMISFSGSNEEINVELDENKKIKKYPSYGLNYATLTIPKVDINNKVYFGDVESILSMGIGHTTWSDMPTEGGVIIYSGHNKKEMLDGLKDIKVSDKIVVDTTYAKCTYEVKKTDIVKDYEIDKLSKIDNKETLILYTCYPFDNYVYTNQRFVVYSVLKEISWK